ncbi:MAG: exonuclease domain-containing protein [Clostridium sp.]|nr:exonuclease domain-containing protein [Clostridium sp.]
MKHIVVDLEMNTVRGKMEKKGTYNMETIEIGAVMLDDRLQEISSFRTYVKPEYNNRIAPNISRLTGITDAMVEHAPYFKEAFRMFANWGLGTGDEVIIYAWSNSDYFQMKKELVWKECELSSMERKIMDTEWNDFQKEFDFHLGFDRQVSLKFALDMAGIDFSGREHDALDDARNTAELLQIFKNESLFNETLRKVKEAMTPSSLENTLGSLFDLSAFTFA